MQLQKTRLPHAQRNSEMKPICAWEPASGWRVSSRAQDGKRLGRRPLLQVVFGHVGLGVVEPKWETHQAAGRLRLR